MWSAKSFYKTTHLMLQFHIVIIKYYLQQKMFKYDEFPILRLQVFNSEGILMRKVYRQKSHHAYFQNQNYSLTSVIDFETCEHMTLKKVFKSKNMSKDSTLAEINNQSKLRGVENFTQIRQVFEDHDNIYMFMEETHSSLQQILSFRGIFMEREVQFIFCQLVTILENLRKRNIFHGAITLSNLYLDEKTMRLKLNGFGQSICIENLKDKCHNNLLSHAELTPYTAPEMLECNVEKLETYYGADIWAVGAVLYNLLTGRELFVNYDQKNQVTMASLMKIKSIAVEFPKPSLETDSLAISCAWKELLKRIFAPKEKRIKLIQLIWHPLNSIAQHKFSQINCYNPPRISHHTLSSEDTLSNLNRTSSSAAGLAIFSEIAKQQILTGGEINTAALRLILQQEKLRSKIPTTVTQPSFIDKFCYVEKHKCLGYVCQNSIGVIFHDGSCMVGENLFDPLYWNNEKKSIDEVLKVYVQLYSELYNKRFSEYQCARQPDCVNENGNMKNTNKSMFAPTESKFQKHQNSSTVSKQLVIQSLSPSAGSTYSNFRRAKAQDSLPHSRLKQSPKSFAWHFDSSSLSKSISSNQLASEVCNTASNFKGTLNSNNKEATKFGESFSTSIIEQINPQKYELFKFFIRYFGERVVPSTREDWLVAFWKLDCGVVMLYNSGLWQINLTQSVATKNLHQQTLQTSTNDNSKGKQYVVLIDQYGLAWEIGSNLPTLNSNSQDHKMGQFFARGKLDRKPAPKIGFASMCAKVARQAVQQISDNFIRQFNNMMEPLQYCE